MGFIESHRMKFLEEELELGVLTPRLVLFPPHHGVSRVPYFLLELV